MGDISSYVCDICNYSSNKKSNIDRHKKSKTHIEKVSTLSKVTELQKYSESMPKYAESMQEICIECKQKFT